MRVLLLVTFCSFACGAAFAAPAPRPKPGPRVIDFSPLAGLEKKFTVVYTLTFEDGVTVGPRPMYADGVSPAGLRAHFIASLPDAVCERDGEAGVILKGWRKDGKVLQVLNVEIRAVDLPKEKQPQVRRLQDKMK